MTAEPWLRAKTCIVAVALLIAAVGLVGCGGSDGGEEGSAGTADPGELGGAAGGRAGGFVFDGVADDWASISPITTEAGKAGVDFDHEVDIKAVYFANDDEYLYVFLTTEPSIEERWRKTDSSSGFVEIYFDTDVDSSTGCQGEMGFDYGSIDGYERRIWMPIGVMADADGNAPMFGADLSEPGEDGTFGFNPIHTEDTRNPGDLIGFGDDGVEFAVPLDKLGVSAGQQIRVLIKEDANAFEKEGYTELRYTVT
jgi:hypothetical protein